MADEEVALMFSDLKKKKKKQVEKPIEVEDQPDEDTAAMFADLKKKKKKKKPVQEEVEENAEEEDVESLFADLKKKKKQEIPEEEDDVFFDEAPPVQEGQDAWADSNRDYNYNELLSRIFQILRQNNPDLQGEKRKLTIVPPQIVREGTKKTAFVNILEISRALNRTPDHLIQYLFAELGTSGSIDGSQRLVIKGKFLQKQIENVLKRYIVEYVRCKTCKSADTHLNKENRLFFLQCKSCGSSRSVTAIKTGFMAQTGKRVKPVE